MKILAAVFVWLVGAVAIAGGIALVSSDPTLNFFVGMLGGVIWMNVAMAGYYWLEERAEIARDRASWQRHLQEMRRAYPD